MSNIAIKLLNRHQLRKTQTRISILEVFHANHEALGQAELEKQLGDIDRITLYRTLRTFEQKGILHQAIDGSGKTRYALCSEGCSEHQHNDNHAHFHCEVCDRTICLDEISTPAINMPKSHEVKQTHLVLSGICEACQ